MRCRALRPNWKSIYKEANKTTLDFTLAILEILPSELIQLRETYGPVLRLEMLLRPTIVWSHCMKAKTWLIHTVQNV